MLFGAGFVQLIIYNRENSRLREQLRGIKTEFKKVNSAQRKLADILKEKVGEAVVSQDNDKGVATSKPASSKQIGVEPEGPLLTDPVERLIDSTSKGHIRFLKLIDFSVLTNCNKLWGEYYRRKERGENPEPPPQYYEMLTDKAIKYLGLGEPQKSSFKKVIKGLAYERNRLIREYRKLIGDLRKQFGKDIYKSKEFRELTKKRNEAEDRFFTNAAESIKQLLSKDKLSHEIFIENAYMWLTLLRHGRIYDTQISQ
jgi:hypothetical protein